MHGAFLRVPLQLLKWCTLVVAYVGCAISCDADQTVLPPNFPACAPAQLDKTFVRK